MLQPVGLSESGPSSCRSQPFAGGGGETAAAFASAFYPGNEGPGLSEGWDDLDDFFQQGGLEVTGDVKTTVKDQSGAAESLQPPGTPQEGSSIPSSRVESSLPPVPSVGGSVPGGVKGKQGRRLKKPNRFAAFLRCCRPLTLEEEGGQTREEEKTEASPAAGGAKKQRAGGAQKTAGRTQLDSQPSAETPVGHPPAIVVTPPLPSPPSFPVPPPDDTEASPLKPLDREEIPSFLLALFDREEEQEEEEPMHGSFSPSSPSREGEEGSPSEGRERPSQFAPYQPVRAHPDRAVQNKRAVGSETADAFGQWMARRSDDIFHSEVKFEGDEGGGESRAGRR
uniref:Uncharacterized protein n=1 Tax=Chromera velia CCMP2878 TaxID=1169474 RepID=A0A0G4HZA5_9ALVE|eukprot:Cvel_9694.t1-p1 / transcript=Cvel_9694.t1 / gene=Cvel_9694 / organism=Chromera_velia_CCMP2878 / gene_product=hypothetical protein / transcript_product=hypothetical protein / location=Cvel_scaffold565:23785-24795(-) / protein_length=337 / sequence_SO=supercontig / SO=protein_coding / is_pseudo=false